MTAHPRFKSREHQNSPDCTLRPIQDGRDALLVGQVGAVAAHLWVMQADLEEMLRHEMAAAVEKVWVAAVRSGRRALGLMPSHPSRGACAATRLATYA
jgi:hypothetical protein